MSWSTSDYATSLISGQLVSTIPPSAVVGSPYAQLELANVAWAYPLSSPAMAMSAGTTPAPSTVTAAPASKGSPQPNFAIWSVVILIVGVILLKEVVYKR